MPWVSAAQRAWGHSAAGLKALGGPSKVSEWDQASKGMKLPQRANQVPGISRKKVKTPK